MAVSKGTQEYLIESEKIVAFGVSHSDDEMRTALCGDVYDKLYDVKECVEIAEKLEDTGFDHAFIMEKLFSIKSKEDWEIGEAYAQAYAESNLNSTIPWGISRDLKKPGSSLPGADIIGLYEDEAGIRFLFGEIKTSSQKEYPPSVMYGEHGLKKQLEDLCQDEEIYKTLVKYLAYRLKKSDIWNKYQQAFKQYLESNGSKVHVLGVLVRDVEPKKEDLEGRAQKLEQFVVNGRSIELVGIYVPVDAISDFTLIVNEECERRSISDAKQ